MTKEERLKAADELAEKHYGNTPGDRCKNIFKHGYLKGAEAEAESNQKDNILIPLWKFKIIENALRMTNNIHNTYKRVSAYDREVEQAYGFAKEPLNQQ